MSLQIYQSLGRSIKKSFRCSKYKRINLIIEITAVLRLISSQVFQMKEKVSFNRWVTLNLEE